MEPHPTDPVIVRYHNGKPIPPFWPPGELVDVNCIRERDAYKEALKRWEEEELAKVEREGRQS